MLKRRILLAEDDEDDRHFFQSFLQTRDDVILLPIAENGVILVEQLMDINDSNELPDIIILDQNMPKRNGLQTLELLKEDKRFSHIPVVIYSTYTDKQLIETCTEAGASAVVPKPITQNGYEEMIDTCLRLAAGHS